MMSVSLWIVLTLCVTCATDFAFGQAPTFDTPCPEDITIAPASGQTSITVDFPPPTGNPDSTGDPALVSCDHEPAGHMFPLGLTLVTCNATDGADSSLVTSCSFQVKFGHGLNCTRGDSEPCLCSLIVKNVCMCEQGFTGVWCTVEDGSGCIDASTPSAYCGEKCVGPGSSCGCETGWKGPDCDAVDDGGDCVHQGNPKHCEACLGALTGPPCTCKVDWRGLSCEIDYIPPTFVTCQDNITETSTNTSSLLITWEDPIATDNSGISPNVSCYPSSGGSFHIGRSEVTCSAFDGFNNVSDCVFVVTIQDLESPHVTCPVSTNATVDPGMPDTTVVWYPSPSAIDAIEGVVEITCYNEDDQVVETGDRFGPGMTKVTCSASDSSGNDNSCEFVITVTDNEGPVVTCPADSSQSVESGMADAAVDWSPLPSAKDAVDGVVPDADVTCVNEAGKYVESGNRFPVGDSVTTCSAFDTSGNEGDCSFVIAIIDNEYPSMTCSKDLEAEALPGMTYATIDWSPVPSSIDAVDGPLDVTCTNNRGNIVESGDTFPVGVTTITCTASDNSGNEGRCGFSTNVTGCSAIFLCRNGGKFSYISCSCECPLPYAGNNCTECQPCQNGGSYQNAITCGCDCPNLYTGLLCSVCQSGDVCLNGGELEEDTCSCDCADGWTGKHCLESTSCVPSDEYPDPPNGVVIEKRISIEIAVISPVLENKTCDTTVNKNSDVCLHLIIEFRQAAEMEYSFLSGFQRVEINQNDLKPGSVIVPHEVIYNYGEMAPSARALSAIGIYEQTVWKSVQTGWLGILQIPTECLNCAAPTDKTYMCNTEKPKCPKGLDMVEMQNSQGTWCYYVCQSRCKASAGYCGEGTCYQEPDSDDILCSCPQSAEILYLGSHCQLRVQLVWLYIGCGIGGTTVLLLFIILVVCIIQRNEENNKYKLMIGGDEQEKRSDSDDGVRGELYMVDGDIFPSRPKYGSSSRSPDTSHLYPYSYIYGKKGGYANMARTEIFWSESPVEVEEEEAEEEAEREAEREAKETTTSTHDQTSTSTERLCGDPAKKRRNWYFWGNLADPIKGETKLIRMVSGTDE